MAVTHFSRYYYIMKITSASHVLARKAQRHGDCYQYDKDQIDLINAGLATIDECDPFKVNSSVKITEFDDCEFEGVYYTDSTWHRQ